MSYLYYTISYIMPHVTEVKIKGKFEDVGYALSFLQDIKGYGLREEYVLLYWHLNMFSKRRISLRELSDLGYVGQFVPDEHGGYYPYLTTRRSR